jgi:hypothetical protein
MNTLNKWLGNGKKGSAKMGWSVVHFAIMKHTNQSQFWPQVAALAAVTALILFGDFI